MTAGELRAQLEGVPDDMPVVVVYDRGWADARLDHVRVDVDHFAVELIGDY